MIRSIIGSIGRQIGETGNACGFASLAVAISIKRASKVVAAMDRMKRLRMSGDSAEIVLRAEGR
jgi:hypothetical protein